MKYAMLLWTCLIAACVSSRPSCGKCTVSAVKASDFVKVPHGRELALNLSKALVALADCKSSRLTLTHAGFYLPETLDLRAEGKSRRCFRIIRWTSETSTVVAIHLTPAHSKGESEASEFVNDTAARSAYNAAKAPLVQGSPGAAAARTTAKVAAREMTSPAGAKLAETMRPIADEASRVGGSVAKGNAAVDAAFVSTAARTAGPVSPQRASECPS
jgi:hypothetical protein